MDTRPAYRRAWEWASEWRWTTSFWVAEVFVGTLAGYVAYVVTDDWTIAIGWLAAGAILVFPVACLWRWWGTPWRDVGILRNAVAELEAQPDDPRRENLQIYVKQRLERLEGVAQRLQEDPGSDRRALLQAVLDEAYEAAEGIGVFDVKLQNYVVGVTNGASQRFRNVSHEQQTQLVRDVIQAVRDAPTLYQGS